MNTQSIEPIDHGDGKFLDVIEIFHSIQGEGPWVGTPATFIRSAGCTVRCPHCYTDYTSGRKFMSVESIIDMVHRPLVVITGGEPFRQNIGPLVQSMCLDYRIQIETNGSHFLEGFPYGLPSIVCSPKGFVHDRIRPFINHWKFLVDGTTKLIELLDLIRLGGGVIGEPSVFLQPLEVRDDPEQTARNIARAIDLCERSNFRLSIQTHKILGFQ
jgi:organic radical activating enzyme